MNMHFFPGIVLNCCDISEGKDNLERKWSGSRQAVYQIANDNGRDSDPGMCED